MIKHVAERYKAFRSEYTKSKSMNPMAVPRLMAITLSVGCGKHHKDSNRLEYMERELTRIAGQKCVITKITKSISNFSSVRAGMPVGMMVTLRSHRMFEFLTRLIEIALPRMQDLTGLSLRSFDKSYNYNFGITRQDIFIESDGNHLFGMNVCFQMRGTKSKEDAINLLKGIGMPLMEGVAR